MKPFATGEVAHTAVTDHRILRRPPSDHAKETTEAMVYTPDDVVLFHRDLLTPAELPVVERDRAVLMSGSNNPALLEALAGTAQGRARGLTTLPKLEAALAAWPDDWAALEGKGSVLWMLNRTEEAAAAFESVLARAPEREMTLDLAATLALFANRNAAAAAYLERAVKIDPRKWRFQFLLAEAHKRNKNWSAALAVGQKAAELRPASVETHTLLLIIHVALGDQAQARKEFDTLMALDPPEAADIRRWYEKNTGKKN